jgi:GNAT superfamily N-acetyltransferase
MAAVLDSVRAFFAHSAFTIDAENAGDVVARENLLDRAMGPNRRRKSSEKIRRGRVPAEGLALVARDRDGHVIGTVRLWNIEAGVNADGTPINALLLGPLAVDAAHEGKGVGSALMRAAIWKPRAVVMAPSCWSAMRLLRALRLLRRQGPAPRHARSVRTQSRFLALPRACRRLA